MQQNTAKKTTIWKFFNMEFNRENYLKLINFYKSKGYKVSELLPIHSRSLIIRHDVDFNLELALSLAKFEHNNNLKSYYFVLVTSNFYNCFSKNSTSILKKILSYGHKIGLHFDSSIYEYDNLDVLISKIKLEKNFLEQVIGQKIDAITFHRPPASIFDLPKKLAGMVNLYSKEYFEDFNYFSDSRRDFRRNPYIFDLNKPIQLLIHPIWFEIDRKDLNSTLAQLKKIYCNEFDINLDNNITNFKELNIP